MTTLYFDCFSGASGDMVLGALLDAGAPEEVVRSALDSLGLEGWHLDISDVTKGGLRATKATVSTVETGVERSYRDIVALLRSSGLTTKVADLCLGVFEILAAAEARVHRVDVDEVHFHEVGSLDAIIDVVGSCAALAHLDPHRVTVSALTTGTGLVTSAHGPLPLPAPAVAEIMAARKAPVMVRGSRELITPTGAALLAAWADGFGPLEPMRVEAIGYGAGDWDLDGDVPNVLRVFVGREVHAADAGRDALLIETNVDDMNPELLPHVIERLIEEGAQDAWLTPIIMKKGRPAHTISVLVEPERRDAMLDVIFSETTTLGLRTSTIGKVALDRTWIDVEVEGHPVRVKVGHEARGGATLAPEYEDAVAAARATGLPLREVYVRSVDAARMQSPVA
jgi:pyridinium-3,5-bisthiocarboxylic acid mononucleotide nickel chelatase